MKIGETIGDLAKKRGINLRQLANKANVPYNTLYAIVKRKSSRVEVETLKRIADALEISVYDLTSQAIFEEVFPKEAQRAQKFSDIKRGFIVMLEEIYGTVEIKELVAHKIKYEYYLIGKDSDTFILYPNDIHTFEKVTKAMIPPIVERIKDIRPESELIRELQNIKYPIPVPEDLIRKLKQESQPAKNAPESTETTLEGKDTTPDETPTETPQNPPEKD